MARVVKRVAAADSDTPARDGRDSPNADGDAKTEGERDLQAAAVLPVGHVEHDDRVCKWCGKVMT